MAELGGIDMALEFEQKFPEQIPSSLPVYELQEPRRFPASATSLSTVAQGLGLSGTATEICLSDEWTVHQEGPYDLGLNGRSGGFVYRHRERYGRHWEDRTFEMSDEEAGEIARRFLDQTGLVPSDEANLLRVTHLLTQGGDREGREAQEPVMLDAGVLFGRAIGKLVVDGPGGKAMINVDVEGQVVGLNLVWRPRGEVVAEVEILPPDRAYATLEEVAKKVRGDVLVTSASFGYFEQGMDDAQRVLQPAYTMIYVVRDEEVAFKSAEVVAAAERVFEPLKGEKRFPARVQKTREIDKGRTE
jgi:hypothetical protein